MTRSEFQEKIISIDELLDFTSEHNMDTLENLYEDDERTGIIEDWIRYAPSNNYPTEIRDSLNNLDFDSYSDYWFQLDNDPLKWEVFEDSRFDEYKQSVFGEAEESGLFDDEDDDENENVVEDSEGNALHYQDDTTVSILSMLMPSDK